MVLRVVMIADAFDAAALNCTADPMVQVFIWEKLAFSTILKYI